MSELVVALQRILSVLDAGDETEKSDWRVIFKSLAGKTKPIHMITNGLEN